MYKWLVIGVFVIGFLLRVSNLSSLPGGFTPDEASFGYDAYSLLQTGGDQWGRTWPLTFKSFGDYKLPVYTYLAMPSVYFFGLDEFSVRLPNAILGSLAVVFTFLLVKELLSDKESQWIALLSALFLSVSPWHMQLSRGAFEANLTTFFLTAGVYFFLRARRRDSLLSLAMLFFGLNLFTYHSARFVTPLLVMSLLWFYRKSFPRKKKYSLASTVFLLFLVLAIVTLLQGSGARASTSTLLSLNLGSGVARAKVVIAGLPATLGKVLYNEPFYKGGRIVHNYFEYLSPSFLLTEGPHETTYGMIPGVGVLSVFEFLGFISFFVWYIKKQSMEKNLLLLWIFLGFFPAAISIGPGNAANRAAVVMPAIQILSAWGIFSLIQYISERLRKHISTKNFRQVLLYPFMTINLLLGLLFFVRYSFEEPTIASYGMMYGMNQLFNFLGEYPTKHVIISRSLSEPHIFAAFYDPISPLLYQNATKYWVYQTKNLFWVDQQDPYRLGRYTVSSIDQYRDFLYSDTFVVGKREEMPSWSRIVKTILSPAGEELWVVAEKP